MLKLVLNETDVKVRFYLSEDDKGRKVISAKVEPDIFNYADSTATCSKNDVFNFNDGRIVAFSRLLRKITSNKLERKNAWIKYATVFSRPKKNKIMLQRLLEQSAT